MGIHDGHRQRLKARFLQEGLSGFEDHNILELLLFYSLPRADTNEIAHELLNEFGSLSAVFDAPFEELCKIKGVSEHSATLIKLIPQIANAYNTDKTKKTDTINSATEAGNYFLPRFFGKINEELHILLLDDKNKIIKCVKVSEGTANATSISSKKIITHVVNSNATSVIMAHNHPSGVALPSGEDVLLTERIYSILKGINVRLSDHIIVADGDFVSMAESAYFERFKYL